MIEPDNPRIPVLRQCWLVELPYSSWKYESKARLKDESEENLHIMRRLNEIYTEHPFYGIRKLSVLLRAEGYSVNCKRVRRLKNKLGLKTLYPKKKWRGMTNKEHVKYPYLLKKLEIVAPDQVWSTDITYIKAGGRNYYLTAVIDWYSRYVVSWELSKTMESDFCQRALNEALNTASPEIFNTDQGSQFTAEDFVKILTKNGINVSMDELKASTVYGKGRCFDNIIMERFWRTIKYEEIYLNEDVSFGELWQRIGKYMEFYNTERIHQSLGYRTPAEVYYDRRESPRDDTKGRPFKHLKCA